MTEDESEVEETVMLTRRDRRRNASVAASPTAPSESEAVDASAVEPVSSDDSADAGDSAAAEDSPGLDDLDEATVVVDRRPERVEEESADDLDEATVVVDRSSSESDVPADVLAEQQEQEQQREQQREQEQEQLVEEPTVLVSRTPRRVRRTRSERSDRQGEASADPTPGAETSAAPISFEAPTDAPAPEIYRPRPAPLGPSAPPVVIGAAAPTRAVDQELPSVAKQGLRWSMAALVSFAAACVVSVAGLVALGFVVFA